MNTNIITLTDSYKFLNNAFLTDVEEVNAYFESRKGAEYPTTVFFGLQPLLKIYLEGVRVTQENINEAKMVALNHLGDENDFNEKMWQFILKECGGKLPLEIKAIPEGTEVPESNALMTIRNTAGSICSGLGSHVETLLTNVWSSCLVATKSKYIKKILLDYAAKTCDNNDHIRFQLHNFAMRSVKSPEAGALNGIGHLINFWGTDTVSAWLAARDYYNGNVTNIGYSVFATEHNYMMYKGRYGESEVFGEILQKRPKGIISVVSDTYDIYNFVDKIIGKEYKDQILTRQPNGLQPARIVVRPDSVTPEHDTPAKMTLWILESLWKNFGGIINSKGFKVLDSHVRIIYGDSLTEVSITDILETAMKNGFSSENIVFGCGSYLMDKHNRDTNRFAYKASAMKFNDGTWKGVYKKPLGSNKVSKMGRLKVIMKNGVLTTVTEYENDYDTNEDQLITVFKNGELLKDWTLDEIRLKNNF